MFVETPFVDSYSTSLEQQRHTGLKPPKALLKSSEQFVRLLRAMKHLVFVVLGLQLSLQRAHCRKEDSCRPVTSSFCQGLGYTTSPHPNGVIGYNLQQIGQMVETACSPNIAVLMCRVVVPECGSDDDSRMKPCRALCEKVKTDCESPFRTKRLYWPTRLRCESLPESNCVQVSMK